MKEIDFNRLEKQYYVRQLIKDGVRHKIISEVMDIASTTVTTYGQFRLCGQYIVFENLLMKYGEETLHIASIGIADYADWHSINVDMVGIIMSYVSKHRSEIYIRYRETLENARRLSRNDG